MSYEQHNDTFEYEMEKLRKSIVARSGDPEITCIPMSHIHDMYKQANIIMQELDRLDARGTNIPDLTIAALRLRAMIFSIPENLNIDNKAKEAQNETPRM